MPRPLIALVARPRREGEVHGWSNTAAAVMQRLYVDAVWRAGGQDVTIAPRLGFTESDASSLLARVDGLVLVGGGDVSPAEYGQHADSHVYGIEPASDATEIAFARAAIAARLPTLAICRGLQVLNVALGGSLIQHLDPDSCAVPHGSRGHGSGLHQVHVEADSHLSRALGGIVVADSCWSFHHQAVDRVGKGLRVTGRSPDGVVEAVEPADGSWAIGVQWHPERTAETDPQQQSLFQGLVNQAER